MPYIRLTLSADSAASLASWVDQFWSLGLLSQLDPAAQLGCHPFHITVIGGLHDHAADDIERALDAIAATVHPFVLGTPSVAHNCNSLQFHGDIIPLHQAAVDAGRSFVRGRPYGGSKPIHITVGRVNKNVSSSLRYEMKRRIGELPPLQITGVEFEDDNGGNIIPLMTKVLSSGERDTTNGNEKVNGGSGEDGPVPM
jgi:hypothetical protein